MRKKDQPVRHWIGQLSIYCVSPHTKLVPENVIVVRASHAMVSMIFHLYILNLHCIMVTDKYNAIDRHFMGRHMSLFALYA
eukprot:scaffold94305_cov19-Prasinocladus_malaysianus.AAC.1